MRHDTAPGVPPPGTVVVDGLWWAPVAGATSTGDEFAAARSLFLELHQTGLWSPWVLEDRADEFDAAMAVMAQWKRAEPGFRQKASEEVKALLARSDAEVRERLAEQERQRLARIGQYDECRERARLALLEQQSLLEQAAEELAGLRDGPVSTAMDAGRRTEQVAVAADEVAALGVRVAELAPQVGDPESVIDRTGQLPDDRREIMLLYFQMWREREVRAARQQIPQLEATLRSTTDRVRRRELRDELDWVRCRHDELADVPPLAAADMCADCDRPTSWHGWVTRGTRALLGAGPCPAWPAPAAGLSRAREILAAAPAARAAAAKPARKPQPLAVVPSGLPLAEVIARLTAIHAEHPDALVKRGRANRWEVWPA